mgnify:CR=1 FL=1
MWTWLRKLFTSRKRIKPFKNELWGIFNAPSSSFYVLGEGEPSKAVISGVLRIEEGQHPAHTHPVNFGPSVTDIASAKKFNAPFEFVVIGIDGYAKKRGEWVLSGTVYYYTQNGLSKQMENQRIRLVSFPAPAEGYMEKHAGGQLSV